MKRGKPVDRLRLEAVRTGALHGVRTLAEHRPNSHEINRLSLERNLDQ